MAFSVGSDPEFFLRNKTGKHVTGIGTIGGTKKHPRMAKHGSVQEDGCAVELNSVPSTNMQDFIANHNLILGELEDMLKPLDLELDLYSPSVIFEKDLLLSDQALVSGCDPDYNAWTVSENEIVDLYDTPIRAAGGHLHVQFEGCASVQDRVDFTRVLDYQLGVPAVLVDTDSNRRTLYGKAGAHRPKFMEKDGFNGIEYRTLSNFWLRSNQLMAYVYQQVEYCNKHWKDLIQDADYLGEEIQDIINRGDAQDAAAFCDYNTVTTYV